MSAAQPDKRGSRQQNGTKMLKHENPQNVRHRHPRMGLLTPYVGGDSNFDKIVGLPQALRGVSAPLTIYPPHPSLPCNKPQKSGRAGKTGVIMKIRSALTAISLASLLCTGASLAQAPAASAELAN